MTDPQGVRAAAVAASAFQTASHTGREDRMDLGIRGRTALITGGDSGIGWHTARILLEGGAAVVLTDKDHRKLAAAADRLAPQGRLHAFAADIPSLDSLTELHESVQDAVGDIAFLCSDRAAFVNGANYRVGSGSVATI